MNKTLLVAGRELRAALATRGFWVQLLMLPLLLAIATSAPRLAARQIQPTTYVIIDQVGDVAKPLMKILDRLQTGPAGPNNQPASVRLPVLPNVDIYQEPAALAEALAPYLKGDTKVVVDGKPQALSAAVVIPRDFGSGPVQILSVRPVQAAFLQQMRAALTLTLRSRALEAHGIDHDLVAQVENIVAPIAVLDPAQQNRPRNAAGDLTGVLAPAILGVLLFVSGMITGARLLNGVIEERSNKLVELILSSMTTGQFMAGKLLGIGFVGIIVIIAWLGSGIAVSHAVAANVGVSVAFSDLVNTRLVVAFVLYFLAAYIMYGAIFLGIGSTADSVQDAQAYMAPLSVMMVLPMMMLTPMIVNPNGPLAVAMSWIPLYTPFTMMLRLPSHPPLWQIVGTTAVMLAFIALMLVMLARLFRVSILAAGASLRPRQILRVMMGASG